MALRNLKLFSHYLRQPVAIARSQRCLSHYPIDDSIFGLNEDQKQVNKHRNYKRFLLSLQLHLNIFFLFSYSYGHIS